MQFIKKLFFTLLVLSTQNPNLLNGAQSLEDLAKAMVRNAQQSNRETIAFLQRLVIKINAYSMKNETDLDAVLAQIVAIEWMEWPELINTAPFQEGLQQEVIHAKNAIAARLERLAQETKDERTRAAAAKRAEELREEARLKEEARIQSEYARQQQELTEQHRRIEEEDRLLRQKEELLAEQARKKTNAQQAWRRANTKVKAINNLKKGGDVYKKKQAERLEQERIEQMRLVEEAHKEVRRTRLLEQGERTILERTKQKLAAFARSARDWARGKIATRAEETHRINEEQRQKELQLREAARLEQIRAEESRRSALLQAEREQQESNLASLRKRDLSSADALWYKQLQQGANADFDAEAQESLSRRRAALQEDDPRQKEHVESIIATLQAIEALPRKIARFSQMNTLGDDERFQQAVMKLNGTGWELLAVEMQSQNIGTSLLLEAVQKDKIGPSTLKTIVKQLNIK